MERELTRREFIVKSLCDKRRTITRETKSYYMTYKLYDSPKGRFVDATRAHYISGKTSTKRLGVAEAIEQLVRNFGQIMGW